METAQQAKPAQDILFRPVWNVPENRLTAYVARHAKAKKNAFIYGETADSAEELLGLDLDLLNATARSLEKGLDVTLVLPVSFSTLTTLPYREVYLAACRNLPESARGHLVLQIGRVPPGISPRRLQSVQRDLATRVKAVVLTSDLQGAHLDALSRDSVHACAVCLSSVPEKDDEKECLRRITAFIGKVNNLRCHAMVDGLASRSLLCAALAAGATYVSGPAVQEDRAEISEPEPFDLFTIYRELAEAP